MYRFGIVALDHHHARRGLAGDQLALALLPVGHPVRHRDLVRRVMQDRHQHQVLLDAQHAGRQLADGACDALEDVPVAARFPCRIHRLRQRVDERVHVGGVEVVLLVPGRGGEHDVAVQRGGAHPEIEGDQQVELALGGLVAPLDLFRLGRAAFAQVLALQAMAGAEQVAQHVFVALAGAAQQVRAPDEHVARKVLRCVGIGEGEVQAAVLELADGVVHRRYAGQFGLAHQLHRVHVELRGGGQPAHPHRAQVEVRQRTRVLGLVRQRGQDLVDVQLLVAPLVGVEVEERRAVHLPRRLAPVGAERERCPAGLRAQLLLADAMTRNPARIVIIDK